MFKSGNLNPYTAIIIPTHEMVYFLVLNLRLDRKESFGLNYFGDSFVTGRVVIKNDCMRMNIFKSSIISFIIRYEFGLAIINVRKGRTAFSHL